MNIREIISLIENAQTEDMKFFHGTSESVETIQKMGLALGRHDAVFLTDNPELALDYALTDQERTGFTNVTLVTVMLSDLDKNYLTGDVDHTNEQDWQDSLSDCDQCMYQKPIPPELLTVEDYT